MEEIKSGELKAEPSPFKPLTEKAREVSQAMVRIPSPGSPDLSPSDGSCRSSG